MSSVARYLLGGAVSSARNATTSSAVESSGWYLEALADRRCAKGASPRLGALCWPTVATFCTDQGWLRGYPTRPSPNRVPGADQLALMPAKRTGSTDT